MLQLLVLDDLLPLLHDVLCEVRDVLGRMRAQLPDREAGLALLLSSTSGLETKTGETHPQQSLRDMRLLLQRLQQPKYLLHTQTKHKSKKGQRNQTDMEAVRRNCRCAPVLLRNFAIV